MPSRIGAYLLLVPVVERVFQLRYFSDSHHIPSPMALSGWRETSATQSKTSEMKDGKYSGAVSFPNSQLTM